MESKKKSVIGVLVAVFGVVLVLVSCATFFLVLNSTENRIKRYLAKAEKMMDVDEYEAAVEWFEKVLELDEKNVEAYLNIAEAYTELDKYEKAVKILEKGYKKTDSRKIERLLEDTKNLASMYGTDDFLSGYRETRDESAGVVRIDQIKFYEDYHTYDEDLKNLFEYLSDIIDLSLDENYFDASRYIYECGGQLEKLSNYKDGYWCQSYREGSYSVGKYKVYVNHSFEQWSDTYLISIIPDSGNGIESGFMYYVGYGYATVIRLDCELGIGNGKFEAMIYNGYDFDDCTLESAYFGNTKNGKFDGNLEYRTIFSDGLYDVHYARFADGKLFEYSYNSGYAGSYYGYTDGQECIIYSNEIDIDEYYFYLIPGLQSILDYYVECEGDNLGHDKSSYNLINSIVTIANDEVERKMLEKAEIEKEKAVLNQEWIQNEHPEVWLNGTWYVKEDCTKYITFTDGPFGEGNYVQYNFVSDSGSSSIGLSDCHYRESIPYDELDWAVYYDSVAEVVYVTIKDWGGMFAPGSYTLVR